MIRPVYIHFAVMLAGSLALGACQQSQTPAPAPEERAPSAPDAKPGLSVSGGRLVLPVVAGRPGAAYFTVKNSGEAAAKLVAVHVEASPKAEMHETSGGSMAKLDELTIAPGGAVSFAQGGKHVMVFDLDDDLKPGDVTEMTLSFADGDKLSADLQVEAMGTMDHGSHH